MLWSRCGSLGIFKSPVIYFDSSNREIHKTMYKSFISMEAYLIMLKRELAELNFALRKAKKIRKKIE